jgi:hypothetical protein
MIAALLAKRAAEPRPWKILERMNASGFQDRAVRSDPMVNTVNPTE